MGKITTIHGCIFGNPGSMNRSDRFLRIVGANARAIDQLPATDEYPPLTRNMFSITASDYTQPGFYKYQMIHFAASLKYIDEAWEEWLRKLEALLRVMYWKKVNLKLELEWPPDGFDERSYEYTWLPTDVALNACFGSESPLPIDAWVFSGGPRSFKNKSP